MLFAQNLPETETSGITSVLVREDLVSDVTLTVISHPYLDDLLEKIRGEAVPWSDYKGAGLITEDEVAMIAHVENKSSEEISSAMSEHGIHYAAMYLSLIHKLARVDAIQKVLILIHDMIHDHDERIQLFHEASKGKEGFPFTPFHRALHINDEFITIQSSKILTMLICSSPKQDPNINEFFRNITFQLQSRQAHTVELNIQILNALFHIPPYRMIFWDTLHAMNSLVNVLKRGSSNPQKVYETLFAIWLLTFEKQISTHLNAKYDVIPTLIDIAKSAVKEKIIRIVVAIFKNFIQLAPKSNLSAMLVAKLLPFVEHLGTRKWSDQDMKDDIGFIQTELQGSFQSMTTFEVYASELETGKLEWSPPHKSENFWRENASRLDEEGHKLLKILARLLSSSSPLVLAIACHDLGQYVKYRPTEGKQLLQSIGAKQRIMKLMTHEDPDVRYYALSATQKYFAMV
ncbi:ATPase, V1 complex, subunit H [Phycomyces blakesleeanus]|uniref:V-type proton ATPase subunit H n=2 Tax=Phycomyces blakesleeanus TaxID=4837 RepID=A0A162PUU8_PHYB8|nr:hypothetical protein PHYBLDRAFT_132260 [Phycomyces blakesleeanus NRRL 1555(-)]OAD76207.1 hypothetical protein PHYBLDRAFT_132260 [Phycomyces blakesleeanus NRRL 1555(-)]|eukprot:XP_018294247.1 hypothetical protein PHYBLDRAFT_132260 [Phycomyces blakesleeanus NRRL 1555(-)]